MPFLANIDLLPPDAPFELAGEAAHCQHPDKVNLGQGVYRDDHGIVWALPTVEKIEKEVQSDPLYTHDYLPILGYQPFRHLAQDFLLGINSQPNKGIKPRIATAQTIAGTGANFLGARFVCSQLSPRAVWLSDPSWGPHELIWKHASNDITVRKKYPYYNKATNSIAFDEMIEELSKESQPGDVIVLHACAHNPTGLDPTEAQWKAIADICEEKKLFPFFDSAYQGFASGDADKDAWAIRYFINTGKFELCIAQSFSKNCGLYGQRVGALHVLTASEGTCARVLSHLTQLQRSDCSTPPSYGARVVSRLLEDSVLRDEWRKDLQTMSSRISKMRQTLVEKLEELNTPGEWKHITQQTGMFSYSGLTEEQVQMLKEKYHIFMFDTGRMCIAGLNHGNIEYVAKSINQVVCASLQKFGQMLYSS